MPSYFDTHLHLQDERLNPTRDQLIRQLKTQGVEEIITNGTSETDWASVSDLAQNKMIRPAFGLHPWKVTSRSENWFDNLQTHLTKNTNALIGEIGLDKWIRHSNFQEQKEVFEKQLILANQRAIPPSIHCLKAWGTLLSILEKHPPRQGFLLHSYSGPQEMLSSFVKLGAYFSFSGYFAKPEKANKLKIWQQIPLERTLIETDAPDMLPPNNLIEKQISHTENTNINSPTNIVNIYNFLADYLQIEKETFAKQIETNYKTLFLTPE